MQKNYSASSEFSVGKYLVGFVLAVALTLLSFIPVMQDMLTEWSLRGKIIYLIGLALIQIFLQIVFFLHLNHGPDARWNLITLFFGATCVAIIIGGTWSAMQYLNYNMMGGSGRIVTPPLRNDITLAPQEKLKHGALAPAAIAPAATIDKAIPHSVVTVHPTGSVSVSAPSSEKQGSVSVETPNNIAPAQQSAPNAG